MERIRGGPFAAAGDPQFFEQFYRRHVDAVTRFVARRVDDPHTAADLTAEIFLAVLDSAHPYRPVRGSETARLYGIARDVVLSERRRVAGLPGRWGAWSPGRRGARETLRDRRISGRRLLDADDIARLEGKLDAESPGRRALAGLPRLPDGERALLEPITVDQLTEAAAALGIRQVTARVRLLAELRHEIELRGTGREEGAEPAAQPAPRRRLFTHRPGSRRPREPAPRPRSPCCSCPAHLPTHPRTRRSATRTAASRSPSGGSGSARMSSTAWRNACAPRGAPCADSWVASGRPRPSPHRRDRRPPAGSGSPSIAATPRTRLRDAGRAKPCKPEPA